MRFVVKETDEVVVQPPISSDAIIGNPQGIFKGLPKHTFYKLWLQGLFSQHRHVRPHCLQYESVSLD